jgi:hypothetical protein
MTHRNEVETFRAAWDAEAQDTLRLPPRRSFAPGAWYPMSSSPEH